MTSSLTLNDAKRIVSKLGLTLVKRDNEYIVKPKGASNDDAQAYFTNDLLDAVETAKRMRPIV
jgi:hypothetical protein